MSGGKKGFIKRHKQWTAIIILVVFCVLMNVLAWTVRGFSDAYAEYVFPVWVNTYGRLTSLLPFSFGEVLIITGIVLVIVSALAIAPLLLKLKSKRKLIGKIYGFTYMWIFVFILLTETLNCFVLYHCSSFGELYGINGGEHTDAQLTELAEVLIARTNELSYEVKRDDDGYFVLTADLDKTAQQAVRALGDDYPRLKGYYVTPKKIVNSYFMSQQYLMGIYFPFSMEANYNQEMYQSNLPETVTHELAHTKGFMPEDEANFIAFLACARSDNKDYNYSGYLSTVKYILGKVGEYIGAHEQERLYGLLNDHVWQDITGNRKYWDDVQESDEGILDSKTVAEVSDKAMETSLKLNGISDGKRSYGRMVDLLLDFYYDSGSIE